MFILQNDKLYIRDSDKIIGVSIHPDKIVTVKGSEANLSEDYKVLTDYEVWRKFNIKVTPYIFPKKPTRKKKEVINDESTSNAKESSGESDR